MLHIFDDVDELSVRVAEAAVGTIKDATRASGSCSLVLSGGSTPRPLYSLLASRFRDRIPWTQVHIFWSDERYVPHDDARGNYRMARESLLDHAPCPAANVHPMPTHCADPDAAARDYETTLRTYFWNQEPCFDLMLLGLGEDGHTASLFPRSSALEEHTRWVVSVSAAVEPPVRLTLTLAMLTSARHLFVLVTGANKAAALHHALHDPLTGADYSLASPAARLRRTRGTLTWWADRHAAAQVL